MWDTLILLTHCVLEVRDAVMSFAYTPVYPEGRLFIGRVAVVVPDASADVPSTFQIWQVSPTVPQVAVTTALSEG